MWESLRIVGVIGQAPNPTKTTPRRPHKALTKHSPKIPKKESPQSSAGQLQTEVYGAYRGESGEAFHRVRSRNFRVLLGFKV